MYSYASTNASAKIKDAFVAIRKRMTDGKFAGLKEGLMQVSLLHRIHIISIALWRLTDWNSLCTEPTSAKQTDGLMQWLLLGYVYMTQLGFPWIQVPDPVAAVVNRTLLEGTLPTFFRQITVSPVLIQHR